MVQLGRLLATFPACVSSGFGLRQKVYCRDEVVMQEGDAGDEMYVCLAQYLWDLQS